MKKKTISIYSPRNISHEIIEKLHMAYQEGFGANVTISDLSHLQRDNNWSEFISKLKKLDFIYFNLGIRLDIDPNGNIYKSGYDDLSFLTDLKNIEVLKFGDSIKDLSFVAHLKQLQSLTIEQRKFTLDLTPLDEIKDQLTFLSLEGKFTNMQVLSHLKSLEKLSLYFVKKFDFNWIINLTCLEEVALFGKITYTHFSKGNLPPNLRIISFNRNATIETLEILEGHSNLKFIGLTVCNNLHYLPNIQTIPKLEGLFFEKPNQIHNWEILCKCETLKRIIVEFPIDPPERFTFLKGRKYEELLIFYTSDRDQQQIKSILTSSLTFREIEKE